MELYETNDEQTLAIFQYVIFVCYRDCQKDEEAISDNFAKSRLVWSGFDSTT